MTDDKSYNGWTNYETWEVKLELDNDEGLYDSMRELAENEHGDTGALASSIKDYVEELIEELYPGVFGHHFIVSTAISTFLGEVNWYEIADSYIEDFGPWDDDEEEEDSEEVQ